MNSSVANELVVVGPGQLGQWFKDGAARAGRRVVEIGRATDVDAALGDVAAGAPVLLATGEDDLPGALLRVPASRRGDVVLVQNELFPQTLRTLRVDTATIVVFWSSIKPGKPLHRGRRTAVLGPHADVVVEIHRQHGHDLVVLPDAATLAGELAAKYAFILAVNALGLVVDRTVGAWLAEEPRLVDDVVAEALALGTALSGARLDPGAGRAAVLEEMRLVASMAARGRTAADRTRRAAASARACSVPLPMLAAMKLPGFVPDDG